MIQLILGEGGWVGDSANAGQACEVPPPLHLECQTGHTK